eukprot:scaffold237_cov233-Pinguiococcus_pyrenoidosus.AAC.5
MPETQTDTTDRSQCSAGRGEPPGRKRGRHSSESPETGLDLLQHRVFGTRQRQEERNVLHVVAEVPQSVQNHVREPLHLRVAKLRARVSLRDARIQLPPQRCEVRHDDLHQRLPNLRHRIRRHVSQDVLQPAAAALGAASFEKGPHLVYRDLSGKEAQQALSAGLWLQHGAERQEVATRNDDLQLVESKPETLLERRLDNRPGRWELGRQGEQPGTAKDDDGRSQTGAKACVQSGWRRLGRLDLVEERKQLKPGGADGLRVGLHVPTICPVRLRHVHNEARHALQVHPLPHAANDGRRNRRAIVAPM